MAIPAKLHFCWIGTKLPWAYVFAILSAAENSDLPNIFLHHTDELDEGAELRALRNTGRIHLFRLGAETLLLKTGTMLGVGSQLQALYARLESPVARADVVRAAILFTEGGIYLDLDTVTVGSLRPLLEATQFLGREYIVWPKAARASRAPGLLARHFTLDLARKALKQLPNGWKGFRWIEKFYILGVNNAVMGSVAGSAFMGGYLRAMLDLPPGRESARYALGPQLLQDVLECHDPDDIVMHAPAAFYPLPPEISEHWFRPVRKPLLSQVLSSDTCVVHWYASVRTKQLVEKISPGYVMQNHGHQLYSALVCAHIGTISQLVADALH